MQNYLPKTTLFLLGLALLLAFPLTMQAQTRDVMGKVT